MIVLSRKKGIDVIVDDDGNLLIAGKPPQEFINIIGNLYKISSVVPKHCKAKKVLGARRRKKALNASVKRFKFSTTLILEQV